MGERTKQEGWECIAAFSEIVIYLTVITDGGSVLVEWRLTSVSKFWFAWKSHGFCTEFLCCKSFFNCTVLLPSKQLGNQGWRSISFGWNWSAMLLKLSLFHASQMLVVWQMRGIFLLLFPPPLSASGIMLLSFIQGSSKHWWIIRSISDLDCSRKVPDALVLAVEGFKDGADRDTRGGHPVLPFWAHWGA